MCISMHFPRKGPRSKETSVAVSTPRVYILISNTVHPKKQNKTGLLEELADSTARVKEARNEPGTSCNTRKQESAQDKRRQVTRTEA